MYRENQFINKHFFFETSKMIGSFNTILYHDVGRPHFGSRRGNFCLLGNVLHFPNLAMTWDIQQNDAYNIKFDRLPKILPKSSVVECERRYPEVFNQSMQWMNKDVHNLSQKHLVASEYL